MSNAIELNSNGRYNGWANYETWNVALWLLNDEWLHKLVKNFTCFESLRWAMREAKTKTKTPDGVSYLDKKVDVKEINEAIFEVES